MTRREILFLSDEFLHPKNRGGRVETANEVALLDRVLGHRVRLLVPRDPWTTPEDESAHRAANPVETWFFDRPPRKAAAIRHPLLPYSAATRIPCADDLHSLRTALGRTKPDLLIAAHDYMWPAAVVIAGVTGNPPILVRSHNDEPNFYRAQAQARGNILLSVFDRLEAARSVLLRARFRAEVAHVAVLSADDAPGYRAAKKTTVVPPLLADVDPTHADPPAPTLDDRRDLLFVGALDVALGRRGLEWFVQESLPEVARRVPDVRLRIVGRGADRAFLERMRAVPHVDMVGEVGDLEPEFARARVFLNPVLGGSGINMKMGGPARRGIPIVTTSIGARGLGALRPGLGVADDPAEFAGQCVRLLRDRDAWQTRASLLHAAYAGSSSAVAVADAFSTLIDGVIGKVQRDRP